MTLALIALLTLAAGPAAASNGDDDGRYNPPDRSQFEGGQRGPNRETPRAKRHQPDPVGEQGALGTHTDQDKINSGETTFDDLFRAGQHLFKAKFNKFDGQGRPNFTSAAARARVDENYLRVSGPDSSSCWQCHNLPRSGGGGDFNALMHSGAHAKDPPEHDSFNNASNHRAGPSIFGAGAMEMLAREMSFELQGIRNAAKAQAASSGSPVTKALTTKGVSFGSLTAMPDGKIDPSQIQGVDWDLIVKPFTHKGTGTSLRGFPTGGGNLHLGMQAVERFGAGTDPDGDGVTDEFSIGDMTAMTVWMASLPVPGRVIPHDAGRRAAIQRGEALFAQVQCASCHTPAMYLDNRNFTEPNPFNGSGLLHVSDVPQPFSFDLTRQGPGPRPERTSDGKAIIRAFCDLKRHNICDPTGRQSEELIPGGSLRGTAPATDFTIAAPNLAVNVFLTEPLWSAGNTGPWGHRGDLTTLTEAILVHGGDAASSRAAFTALTQDDKDCLLDFLKSMQIVPVDAPRITDVGEDVR